MKRKVTSVHIFSRHGLFDPFEQKSFQYLTSICKTLSISVLASRILKSAPREGLQELSLDFFPALDSSNNFLLCGQLLQNRR